MDDNFPFGVQAELTEVLRSFHGTHPDVFLTLRTSSAEHVAQLVLEGSADIGISAIPRIVPEVLVHPLFQETMTLYCGARHPLFARSESQITRKLVTSFECVDVASRQNAEARAATDQMRVRARAATIHARMLLVLSGAFLAFLPRDFAGRWVELGAMRPLLPSELSYEHTCFAIVKKDTLLSAACGHFLEELKRVFGRAAMGDVPKNTSGR
jgi:DNA-binding transcriptional LysR family regulator